MTPFMSLLLPIVLASVAVSILSMIIDLAMPWHRSDYANVPNHDAAIAGWVTGTIVAPGGNPRAVFHWSAIITACSYGFGGWTLSIWYHRRWSTAFGGTFDAILYGLATGAVFMWTWPRT